MSDRALKLAYGVVQLLDQIAGYAIIAEKDARSILAPFVRQYPDAAPEALYLHHYMVLRSRAPLWADRAVETQLAYGLFGLVLVMADAGERRRAAQKPKAVQKPRPIAKSERTLGGHDGLRHMNNLGKASKVTPATPRRKDAPAAAAAPRKTFSSVDYLAEHGDPRARTPGFRLPKKSK